MVTAVGSREKVNKDDSGDDSEAVRKDPTAAVVQKKNKIKKSHNRMIEIENWCASCKRIIISGERYGLCKVGKE